ncbi:MAG: hypothetical protein PHW01_02080 [Patescibacteria group bacterium]|nr:hypothetical protein [Patescibacteria group bacterium]
MKKARGLIAQAEREISRLENIQDDPKAARNECDLREGVGNLKSDLCHDHDPMGSLHNIPDEWVLTENAVKSYKLLQGILNSPIIKFIPPKH